MVEPFAHEGHDGEEYVVEEVDVEGACADVLECASEVGLFGKGLLVVAEKQKYDGHGCVHGEGAGEVGPHHAHGVPA